LVKTVPSPVGTVYRMKPATMSTAPVLMDVMQDMKEPTVHKVNQFKRVILFQRKWHFLDHMSHSVTVSYATFLFLDAKSLLNRTILEYCKWFHKPCNYDMHIDIYCKSHTAVNQVTDKA
jgi:hypothetical protein